MESEFNREKDISAKEQNDLWKTIENQLLIMKTAIKKSLESREEQKLVKRMDSKINEELSKDGKSKTDRENVGKWFWSKVNKSKQDKELAEKQCRDSRWLSRGKWKELVNKAEKDEKFWLQMRFLWQSSDHAMTGNRDRKSKQIKDSSTVEMLPSYELFANQPTLSHHTAPTSPLTGLYPTLQVTGGKVSVCDLPPVTAQPPPDPPCSAPTTLLSSHSTGGSVLSFISQAPQTDPFADQLLRDKLQPPSGPIKCSTPYISHSPSDMELVTPLKSDVTEGSVNMSVSGKWIKDEPLTAVTYHDAAMQAPPITVPNQSPIENEEVISSPSNPMPLVPEATPPPAGHGYNMRPRTHPKPPYMGPLFQQQYGGNRYKPFTMEDITTLCDKLPPISEGASIWLQTLDSLT
ncbi:hypothetical protein XENOCAPTIV_020561, partial [Xenoophorus captivus]